MRIRAALNRHGPPERYHEATTGFTETVETHGIKVSMVSVVAAFYNGINVYLGMIPGRFPYIIYVLCNCNYTYVYIYIYICLDMQHIHIYVFYVYRSKFIGIQSSFLPG